MRKLFIFPACITIALVACSKKSHLNPGGVNDPTTAKLYFSGVFGDTGYIQRACYWKNDSLTALPGGTISWAWAIATLGSDVYVAGSVDSAAAIWKNGVLTPLTDGLNFASANAIAVSGQDVYVFDDGTSSAGHRIIWQWLNGQLTNLSPDSITTFFGDAKVVNGSVYVTGYGFSSSPNHEVAKLWVNGQETDLSDGSRNVATTGIFISGSDVYISGYETDASGSHYIAMYWKNGQPVILSDSSGIDIAASITVSGGDVYVPGSTQAGSLGQTTANNVGGYWKNGTFMNLTDGAVDCNIGNLVIDGSELYVGYWGIGDSHPTYFKNGKSMELYLNSGQPAVGAVLSIFDPGN
jgi:hypothetical protein